MDEIVRESEPLALEVKRTEAERQKHESQLQALRTLREIDSEEVKIESRAIVVPSGVSSNRKKLTLIVFALSMVVCLGLMTGYEMSTSVWRAETLAGRLHLPVLVRSAPSKDERSGGLTQDQARALSLRIRQHVPDAGGVVLLTSLNEGKEVDNLAGNLSRYFSMRDEKVLILDARIQDSPTDGLSRLVERQGAIEVVPESDTPSRRGGAGLPGLVQYLVFEGQDPARFIRPTRFAAVDYLPSGGPYSMTDVLASEPMKELLDEQRKKYTLVLIAAPALARRVDVEILAAYVNGLVAVIDPPLSSGTPAIEEFMQSLKDAGVPLLGAVISV
jgi:Mrp family chromosome partitioning ATPase